MSTRAISIAIASVLVLLCGTARASADLARSRNCLACHATDRKLVGPAFRNIAAKYASDREAAQRLTSKVRDGGSGVWGQVPMPPNPQVSPEEADALVRWILSLK